MIALECPGTRTRRCTCINGYIEGKEWKPRGTCMQNGSTMSTVRNFDRPENKVGLLGTLPIAICHGLESALRTKTMMDAKNISHFTLFFFFSKLYFANCPKHSTDSKKERKTKLLFFIPLLFFFFYSILCFVKCTL